MTTTRTTLAALAAVTAAAGAAVWALSSCTSPAVVSSPADAAPNDQRVGDAPYIHPPKPDANDGGPYGPLGCTERPGWIQGHPFRNACTIQIAPPSMWPEIAYPLVPCPNGQPKCVQMVIPRNPNTPPGAFVLPIESEAEGFHFQLDADPEFTICRRIAYIVPTATSYQVRGAIEINLRGGCDAVPHAGNGEYILTGLKVSKDPLRPKLFVSRWEDYAPRGGVELSDDFAQAWRTGDTVYAHEPNYGKIDVISLAQGKLLRTVRPPNNVRQWFPRFARDGDFWGVANYGQLGKGELWRTDALGNSNVILQKAGVHVFAPNTDGTTMFWIEASGNELDLLDQPKVEVWAGPYSKDGAVTRAGARRLLDVSGVRNAQHSTARRDFFAVNLGGTEFLVIRGRDGAHQRVTLLGGWASITPAYVDEKFVWFEHGASNPFESSVARMELEPWPP
jgi:hypothetical protein